MSGELCPACGRAPQTDERTGWCDACLAERRAERYLEKGREEARLRSEAWEQRAIEARRAWDLERQRRHRLLVRVRPRRPAPPGTDPLELAAQALELLEELRGPAARAGANAHLGLEQAMELVRTLAWGPELAPLSDRLQAGETDPTEHAEALGRCSSEAEDGADEPRAGPSP
ncbi:MAG TPA: hypothetical protein VNO79_10935 [Actinomycetota bacterium]|nr:hypothetical protein [Actinomycetota bacterium]